MQYLLQIKHQVLILEDLKYEMETSALSAMNGHL